MDTNPRPSRASAAGDLRVSDADRDQVLAELSEHFQAGRLTADEMEDRTGRALSARTGNDLAVLLADLPPAHGVAPAGPAQRSTPAFWICVALCAAAVAAVADLALSSRHAHVVLVPWWLILVALFVLRRRRRNRDEHETPAGQLPASEPGARDERS